MQEGYCDSFAELMESTEWNRYGCASGNPKCVDCMVHSGYEATAVAETFGTLRGLARAARVTLFGLGDLPETPSPEPPVVPPPHHRPASRDRELVQLQV